MAIRATGTDIRQLSQALANLGVARLANPAATGTGKAFELWLMFRIADRWRRRGWKVEVCDVRGQTLAPGVDFITRGSPGQIARRSETKRAGFIFVDRLRTGTSSPDRQFEMHGSLQFRGRSDALHECDIAVIPADMGDRIRGRPAGGKGQGAPVGIPPIAIECKRHVKPGPVGETREMTARLFDLSRIPTCSPVGVGQIFWPLNGTTVGWGTRFRPYRSQFGFGYYAIARSSGFTSGAKQMSIYFRLHGWGNMRGNRSVDLADELRKHIVNLTWTKVI